MTRQPRNLLLGLVLLAIGLAILLVAAGVSLGPHLWKIWPLSLIAAGAWLLLVRPGRIGRPEKVLLGLCCLAGTFLTLAHEGDRRSTDSRRHLPEQPPGGGGEPGGLPARIVREATLDLPGGGPVRIEISGADLTVNPGPPGQVHATSLDAGEPGDPEQPDLSLERAGEGVVLRFPGRADRPGRRLEVRVPPATSLSLDSDGGDVTVRALGAVELRARGGATTVEGLQGALQATVENGGLTARGISGPVTVDASVAAVVLDGIAGLAVVRSAWGGVDIRRAAAGAEIASNDGAVRVAGAAAPVRVVALRAPVELASLSALATVELRDGRLLAEALSGGLVLEASGSPVEARGIGGPANLRTSGPSLKVEGGAAVRVVATGGQVELSGATGPVEVEATGAGVRVRGATASVRIAVRSGDVRMEALAAMPVEVTVEDGNVDLSLGPAGQTAGLDLSAAPGRIVDATGSLPAPRRDGVAAYLETTGRQPGPPLVVRARQGSIRVRP